MARAAGDLLQRVDEGACGFPSRQHGRAEIRWVAPTYAEAGLGHTALGAQIVEGLLGQYGHADNPLLVGLLHRTRAEIALLECDRQTFDQHFAQTERRFRGSNNPALLAGLDRLLEQATQRGLRRRKSTATQSYADATLAARHTVLSMRYALTEHSVATNRQQHALRLITEHARASAGFLFAYADQSMRLAAASTPALPPSDVQTRLEELAIRQQFEDAEHGHAHASHAVAEAEGGLKTLVARRSSRRLQRSLHPPNATSEVELVTEIDSDSASPATVTSQATAPRGSQLDPDSDQEVAQTVFVPSDRPEPSGGAQQLFLLRVPGTPPDARERVVGGLILDMEPKQLYRIDPEILAIIAQALTAT